ncbi:hypothetical protein P3H15_11115 [Rhodococcus sp. T2V]|uniref:hypothetical protein n=1 Tax=Rhodococcus sp. T2V TaxID=3034164 RepID=UPI0023E24C83|nr:hypothetical protein [Rhodococcus sp. T2V]MDF3305572.1 hypothetical protein [Rhodococcus sp. T2V]
MTRPEPEVGPPTLTSPVTPLAPRQVRADAVSWGPVHAGRPPRNGRKRVLPVPPGEPERPLALHDSWFIVLAAALLAALALAGVLWISVHVRVDPVLHTAALFVHLASLVLGFGGVLIADYLVLLWISGRSTLAEAIRGAERLHLPIWAGLAGLVASGALLEPDLASTLTRTKLVLVLLLTVNGLQALILGRRIAHSDATHLPARLTLWGAATALISQLCWWGAVWIGFWNAEH